MSQGVGSVRFEGDERVPTRGESRLATPPQTVARTPAMQDDLEHVRNVTRSVAQDALNIWADIWGELENGVACDVAGTPEAEGPARQVCDTPCGDSLRSPNIAIGSPEKGFTPSCGWPEFLEKMWILRQNLDFLARFSRQ